MASLNPSPLSHLLSSKILLRSHQLLFSWHFRMEKQFMNGGGGGRANWKEYPFHVVNSKQTVNGLRSTHEHTRHLLTLKMGQCQQYRMGFHTEITELLILFP